MGKNNSFQRIDMLRQRNALLNDRLRLEREMSEIKQKLAELEAAIYLQSQNAREETTQSAEDTCQCRIASAAVSRNV